MRSKQITSGAKVAEFEDQFGPNSIMCNSGSSANLLAIAGLCSIEDGLKPGDEVIVPALCWSTTVWPLVQYGLVPVIVDIDPNTLNIDPEQIAKAITHKTRAIMVVHVYGNPCDMDALAKFKDDGFFLIEDCCEALGAKWNGKQVGYFGDVGTFSFYFSHHITTGEGGMCVTRFPELAEQIRILRAHGWVRDMDDPNDEIEQHSDIDPRFLFVNAGYNLRCTEMQAAMGLVQLPKLAHFVERRRLMALLLKDHFDRYRYKNVFTQKDSGGSSWFGFPVILDHDSQVMRDHFGSYQIETRPIICGNIARQPGMKRFKHRIPFSLYNADTVMHCGFALPCHQAMEHRDAERIGNVLADYRLFR